MFLWHVGERLKQHFRRESTQDGRAFGNRRQVPVPARQNFGNAEQLAAPELPFHRMAVQIENLDQASLDKEKMRCRLAWPEQGLAMEQRDADGALHNASARQPPLRHLGGDRA